VLVSCLETNLYVSKLSQLTGDVHSVDLGRVRLHTVDVSGGHDVEGGAQAVEEHGHELHDQGDAVHHHEQ